MAQQETHTVQIVGDGMDGRWITWRWSEGLFPAGVAKTEGLDDAARDFSNALPQNRTEVAVRRSLRGGLTVPKTEARIMRALSQALLPAQLREEIQHCIDSGAWLRVQVAPSPQAAAVPWGLLFLDDNRRLLDVADITWLAPVLLRDLGDSEAPAAATPDATRAPSPLHIIDPSLAWEKQLFNDLSEIDGFLGEHAVGERREVTSGGLSKALKDGPTRFYFLGHCSPPSQRSDSTGMVLSNPGSSFQDSLTADELMKDPGRWPMPSRAAVVACASGVDMADFEPFGLATALLNNGAGLVQATLWTLPTDHALKRLGRVKRRPFLSLAMAVDAAQRADDPAAHLNSWQRHQLRKWRGRPLNQESVDSSPLLWGAAMTMTAPPRRLGAEH
ncbi:MAG TPA: CHAT domain-containing protein [Arachnia sp.]|nr:CHAT domain-containing protein [Arachnia sp.]HMT84919.1 CHAT domain-containing protein [Arachnia sp.]